MRTLALLLAGLALVLFTSCGTPPPPRGSAQDQAASAAGRAEATTALADAAGIDAARAHAEADELARQADAQPTAERIQRAADARVKAVAARAVEDALLRQADAARAAALQSAIAARDERAAELLAADLRRWANLCRWIGLGGLAIGALLGGVLGWLAGPRLGVPIGAIVAGTGLLVVAFGATIAWLPLVLAGLVVAGLVAWIVVHQRALRVGLALSKTVDALEGRTASTVGEAKQALRSAVTGSGLAGRIERARARWKVSP